MKSVIRRLLRESLESEADAVLMEGIKYFPKLKMRITTTRTNNVPEPRFFSNYPKNKGSFSIGAFKKYLAVYKILQIEKWLKNKSIKIISSNTTHSIYFNYNGINFRLSDHKSNRNDVTDIIIKWDTPSQLIVDALNKK